jgi:two-component system, OmpR family, KDP operon response regulator KdpE
MTVASRVILIVEDDAQLRRVLRTLLELDGYRLIESDTAARGLTEARTHKPDLVILDLGLPDQDGMEVISGIREFSTVPILVLSARTDEAGKVAALEGGADDYVTKPVGARELSARVRVALRHHASAALPGARLYVGVWEIDLQARTTQDAQGAQLHLTPIEYRLLEVLSQHLGLVVTHRALLKQVWGPASTEQTHYLRVYIKQLRAKLEPEPSQPRWLLTETGVGYRLVQRDKEEKPEQGTG